MRYFPLSSVVVPDFVPTKYTGAKGTVSLETASITVPNTTVFCAESASEKQIDKKSKSPFFIPYEETKKFSMRQEV